MKIWFWTEQTGSMIIRMGSPCRIAKRKKDLRPDDFYCLERMGPEMIERMGLEFMEQEADKAITKKIELFIRVELPKRIEALRKEQIEVERMIQSLSAAAPSAVRALKDTNYELDQLIQDLEWYTHEV